MSNKHTSLDFLQAVYLNETLPLPVRSRAAIEAAPLRTSKALTAVAVGHLTGVWSRSERFQLFLILIALLVRPVRCGSGTDLCSVS